MSVGSKTVNAITRSVCLAACISLLAACSGRGSVHTGGGQAPDPATVDFPIFYVKRVSVPKNQDDLRRLRVALASADLFMRANSSPSATETNITARVTGTGTATAANYDLKDLNVSADGTKVIFAMRGPLAMNMQPEDPPTWAIWEYDIPNDALRRIISDDTTADAGQDVAPAYLPDGRIVFSSTRQRQSKAVLLDEGKPQFEAQNEDRNEPAFVLHVMDPDGGNIHQVSFNQSDDRDPTVLASGRLLWSRWDHAPGKNGMHLYSANPDGTDLQLHYGANSHNTGSLANGQPSVIEFVKPREMLDGRILTLIRPFTGTDFGGDLTLIDTQTYVENTQPTLASAGMSGPAQTAATPNDVSTIPGPSPDGRFNSAFPLWDGSGRILVSWTQCRLLDTTVTPNAIVPCTDTRLADPNVQTAPPLYSVWMFDPAQNTLQPVMPPVEGVMVTDVVAAQPRALPAVILDKVPGVDLDQTLVDAGVGVLNIRSVYDFDGTDTAQPNIATVANPGSTTAAQRPARFIRLEKAVSIPDRKVIDLAGQAFGASNFMREILGYAPVEPDGSVRIEVPANVAFQISVLDVNGQRISPIHEAWLQLHAGEELKCNGCHTPASTQNPPAGQTAHSHGRANLFNSVNAGAAATGTPFPNTVATFSPNAGESMAETRSRTSCANDTPRCAAMVPSVDVLFQDVWTNPAVRAIDPPLSYSYRDQTFTTLPPTVQACLTAWSSTCRITVNYTEHIQPLWDKSRQTLDPMTQAVLTDHTCTQAGCHNTVDANAAAQVPAGQLDLTNTASNEEPLQLTSYRRLLFPHNQQTVTMGALQDVLVPGPIDPNTGQPTQVPVSLASPMAAGNAHGSTAFFSRFAAGGSHAGYLSTAELRLLSEWLDIGAQYFNNPFDPAVPVN